MAILILGVLSVAIGQLPKVEAKQKKSKPFYSKGDHELTAIVQMHDQDEKSNNCWGEVYARATPKNNNHDPLNKQTVKNDNKPSNGPSETLNFKWKFKDSVMKETSSTNEGKIRTYATIELANEQTGETVTKYKNYDAGTKKIDFGLFILHTDPSQCPDLKASIKGEVNTQ